MPSVHNGLAALFALAASRLNRIAGWALWAYAALIWLGSIHLGWHYALDGIVGIALTYGIWIVCGAHRRCSRHAAGFRPAGRRFGLSGSGRSCRRPPLSG